MASHHLGQRGLRLPRRRPRRDARRPSRLARDTRRGGRRAPRVSGPGRLRPARDAMLARGGRGPRALPGAAPWPAWPPPQGVRLQHVKAHGALYNMACRDRGAGRRDRPRRGRRRSIADPVRPAGLRIAARPGEPRGLRVAAEVLRRPRLRCRRLARLAEPGRQRHPRRRQQVVARAVQMVARRHGGRRRRRDRFALRGRHRSACTATPGAPRSCAAAIRQGLEAAGVSVNARRSPK